MEVVNRVTMVDLVFHEKRNGQEGKLRKVKMKC